jgi:hypothetical protein
MRTQSGSAGEPRLCRGKLGQQGRSLSAGAVTRSGAALGLRREHAHSRGVGAHAGERAEGAASDVYTKYHAPWCCVAMPRHCKREAALRERSWAWSATGGAHPGPAQELPDLGLLRSVVHVLLREDEGRLAVLRECG